MVVDWSSGRLRVLRATALVALVVGAIGSFGLMLYAGRHAPRLLIVLFTIWVLAPFIALAVADVASKRWAVLTRMTLYCVMLVLAIGCLAAYAVDATRPPRPQAAFVYVAVPALSWLLLATAVPLAALISRRRSRRAEAR